MLREFYKRRFRRRLVFALLDKGVSPLVALKNAEGLELFIRHGTPEYPECAACRVSCRACVAEYARVREAALSTFAAAEGLESAPGEAEDTERRERDGEGVDSPAEEEQAEADDEQPGELDATTQDFGPFALDPPPPHDHDKGGRIKWTDDLNAWLARQWHREGCSVRQIGDVLGVGEGTIHQRAIKTLGLPKRGTRKDPAETSRPPAQNAPPPDEDPEPRGAKPPFTAQPGDGFTAGEVDKIKDMWTNGADVAAIAATTGLPSQAITALIDDKVGRGFWVRSTAKSIPGFRESPVTTQSRVVDSEACDDPDLARAVEYLEACGLQVQQFKGLYDVVRGTEYLEEGLGVADVIAYADGLKA